MGKKLHVSTTINGEAVEFLCEARQSLLGAIQVDEQLAEALGLGEGLGQRLNQGFVSPVDALVNQGGVAGDEVDADVTGGAVEGFGRLEEKLWATASGHQGDGGDRDALVDDGDTEVDEGFEAIGTACDDNDQCGEKHHQFQPDE